MCKVFLAETRAFSLMSHALVLREKALYERFMRQIIADAAVSTDDLTRYCGALVWVSVSHLKSWFPFRDVVASKQIFGDSLEISF